MLEEVLDGRRELIEQDRNVINVANKIFDRVFLATGCYLHQYFLVPRIVLIVDALLEY